MWEYAIGMFRAVQINNSNAFHAWNPVGFHDLWTAHHGLKWQWNYSRASWNTQMGKFYDVHHGLAGKCLMYVFWLAFVSNTSTEHVFFEYKTKGITVVKRMLTWDVQTELGEIITRPPQLQNRHGPNQPSWHANFSNATHDSIPRPQNYQASNLMRLCSYIVHVNLIAIF